MVACVEALFYGVSSGVFHLALSPALVSAFIYEM